MTSNDYKARRLLLRTFPAEDSVTALADEMGWPFVGRTEEDPEEDTVLEVMWMVSPDLVLHYAEDRMSKTAYVMASSWSPERAEEFAAELSALLDVRSLGDLLNAVDAAADEHQLSLALTRLTLGAPREYDVDVYTRVCRGLIRSDATTRLSAIWAIGFMPWPEYKKALAPVAAKDPDHGVRAMAEALLESYRLEEQGDMVVDS